MSQRLRHIILIKFKEQTTPEEVARVEEAFAALPDKITGINLPFVLCNT